MAIADNNSIELSIVIVNYNVRNLLENCLHSVQAALGDIRSQIFVVDNNSDDGSVEMITERFPDVHVIANQENVGFARANNQALILSKGRYLLLLNPDTLVQEDSFSAMISFFESHPDVGLASCKIINPDGSLEQACRRSFPSPWVAFTKLTGLSSLFPKSKLFAKYNLTYLDENEGYEVDAVSGSFMFLRREVYDRIGGLDEQYFMYGEDLDWCYRVQSNGWKVQYVPDTQIVHYGGESTSRSSIDARAIFYQAMDVFTAKNLKISKPGLTIIRLGIKLRLWIARFRFNSLTAITSLADAVLVLASILLVEYFRFDGFWKLPAYAYPTFYIVAVAIVLVSLVGAGTYSANNYRFIRAGIGVVISFFLLSSLTFFFNDFAFSRAIVLISSLISLVAIMGYRLLIILLKPSQSSTLVTGRPTLIVGLNESTGNILLKLKRYDSNDYRINGIIDTTHQRIGELYHGVPVLGSTDNIVKIIRQHGITDVIFIPDILSNSQILSLISKTRSLPIHYRIVPKSLEFIVGKAHIDQLISIPLVDVDYNLLRLRNRVMKRILDLAVSLPCLIALFPFVYFLKSSKSRFCSFSYFVQALPALVSGRKSLVGYPDSLRLTDPDVFLGKPGLTGLAQLRHISPEEEEEIVSLSIQYVRNHSVFLDIEILLRTFVHCLVKRK
jgi:GT2 family glycosyltransferase